MNLILSNRPTTSTAKSLTQGRLRRLRRANASRRAFPRTTLPSNKPTRRRSRTRRRWRRRRQRAPGPATDPLTVPSGNSASRRTPRSSSTDSVLVEAHTAHIPPFFFSPSPSSLALTKILRSVHLLWISSVFCHCFGVCMCVSTFFFCFFRHLCKCKGRQNGISVHLAVWFFFYYGVHEKHIHLSSSLFLIFCQFPPKNNSFLYRVDPRLSLQVRRSPF